MMYYRLERGVVMITIPGWIKRLLILISGPIWIPIFIVGAVVIIAITFLYDQLIHKPYTYVRYGNPKGFFYDNF